MASDDEPERGAKLPQPADSDDLETLLEEEVDGELSPEKVQGIRRIVEEHSGPLPTPDMLERYGNVIPGLDQVIVDQWTSETTHRREQQVQIRQAYFSGQKEGRRFGFALGIAVVVAVLLSIVLDRQPVGVAAILVGGGILIWNLRRQHDNSDSE